MIVLIISYTLLFFVYFSFDCEKQIKYEDIFLYIEISILTIFSAEIILNVVALNLLYLRDPWNIFDLIIIILSIIFVLMDAFI